MISNPETLIHLPTFGVPATIDTDAIDNYRLTDIDEQLVNATNRSKDVLSVYLFESLPHESTGENEGLPLQIAEWLHYRTFTENIIAAEHERDRDRFESIDDIKSKFLSDKSGRDLYVAIDNDLGRLYGVTWFRPIPRVEDNDKYDFQLADVADEYLTANSLRLQPGQHVGTIAVREYGVTVKSELGLNLAGIALDDHFRRKKGCRGVIGRFGSKDTLLQEITDTEGKLTGKHSFKEVSNGFGWAMLMAISSENDDNETSQSGDNTL